MTQASIPANWLEARLGDIAEQITKGTTPTTAGHDYKNSGIAFIKIENIDNFGINLDSVTQFISEEAHEELKRSQFQVDDVLFSIAGTIGKTALVEKKHIPANTNQAVAIIRGIADFFDPVFLRQQLKLLASEIARENSRGGAMNNVSLGDLKGTNVYLPPLAEQKQIAAKLDELLAQVDTIKDRLDAIPKILKRFRQSVLAAAVSGRLTEEWRLGTCDSKTWNTRRIEDLATAERYSLGIGPFGSNLKVSDYRSAGHPLVFVREIRARNFGDQTTKYVDTQKFNELAAHRVKPGNILITKMGDPPGDVAIYPIDRPEAVITSDCIKLSVDESIALKEFIFYSMQADQFKSDVLAISAGVAQQKVSLTKFRNVELDIPPLEEQTEIVRRVEQLFAFADQIEQRVKDATARVNHLTQSILAKAFRGELTADWRAQNPDLISGENSATALLERIRAQRDAAGTKKKGHNSTRTTGKQR